MNPFDYFARCVELVTGTAGKSPPDCGARRVMASVSGRPAISDAYCNARWGELTTGRIGRGSGVAPPVISTAHAVAGLSARPGKCAAVDRSQIVGSSVSGVIRTPNRELNRSPAFKYLAPWSGPDAAIDAPAESACRPVQCLAMSTCRVSGRKIIPITRLPAAITIGYQSPE
jgi:hypothetical protein